MTREEFMKFASAISSYYPRDNFLPTDESKELWYAELKDIDYEIASIALRKYVQTNKWIPTIADIRASVAESKRPDEGWSKGWKDMKDAIRKFGYTQEREAMASLDPITRETTRRLGWREICQSEETDPTTRANFRMIYEQVANRRKERDAMSSDVLDIISRLQIGGGEVKLLGDDE